MSSERSHVPSVSLERCLPGMTAANHFAFAPGQKEGPWAAASRLLLYVRDGRGTATWSGRNVPLVRGDYCFLEWGEPIRYAADGRDPFSVITCHFIPHVPPDSPEPTFRHVRSTDKQYQDDPFNIRVPELDRIATHGSLLRLPNVPLIMDRLLEEHARPTSLARALVIAYVKATFAELAVASSRSALTAPHPRAADVLRVRQYLDINFKEPLSREWMAEMAGMSPAHFTRAFRAVTGTTPHRFLLHRRLTEVQVRLRMSSAVLKQIASETGFRDEFHLSHAFKQAFGMAPQAYRRQATRG